MEKKALIEAGRIVNTHGVQGEVKIEVWLDSPQFMKSFRRLVLDSGEELKVLGARAHKGFLIARLEGVEDVNAAMALKGRVVQIDRADAKLPGGSYFLQDILGAAVVTEEGEAVGTLDDVLELPGHRVYVVRGETEHLIPAVPEFVREVDPEAGRVTVHLIEGM